MARFEKKGCEGSVREVRRPFAERVISWESSAKGRAGLGASVSSRAQWSRKIPTLEIWRQPSEGHRVADFTPCKSIHIAAQTRERVMIVEGRLAAEMNGIDDAAERVEI